MNHLSLAGNGTASGYYDNGEDDFGENPEEDDECNRMINSISFR